MLLQQRHLILSGYYSGRRFCCHGLRFKIPLRFYSSLFSGNKSVSQSDRMTDSPHIFELQVHQVKPKYMNEYISDFSGFVSTLKSKTKSAELVGSWTCEIGDQDTAYHLWKFPTGYNDLNLFYKLYKNVDELVEYHHRRNYMLRSRRNQICLPFSFWPEPLPHPLENGSQRMYELRSYALKPGTFIEWGNYWARAIRHRSQADETVTGFFSHIGEMHVVHHIWAYADLEDRKKKRQEAWMDPGWYECVRHTVPLIRQMKTSILQPTPFSLLQ